MFGLGIVGGMKMSTRLEKYAAIYIRTSSEHQGEKSSPDEQEADCRRVAKEHELSIVAVYKDIERYRVKRKLIEPSGTRTDRPGLQALLADAADGQFSTILAWREDRLYRGMRAMLNVLDVIQEYKLNVILARESFDPKMAPIKAWVAQMELDGMRERMSMGVKARLRAGKANTGQDRYGYKRNGEIIEVVEEEAKWVRQIFAWYLERVPLMEIRRRLIEAGAPQKGSSVPRKIHWAKSSIQSILSAAKEYAYGIKIYTRDGEKFEIPVPPIIDLLTHEKFLKVREANKTHPVRNVKHDYLISGFLYCPCERKWQVRTASSKMRRNRRGELVPRKSFNGVYWCPQFHKEAIHPDCPRSIGQGKAEDFVWNKVCGVILKPESLLMGVRQYVDELLEQSKSVTAENERIQKELDAIAMERQWVITQARKGRITDEDLDYQLGSLTFQELSLRRDMIHLSEVIDFTRLEDWEGKVCEYLSDLQLGLESLNAAPRNKEERHEIFKIKKKIVETLVEKVLIGKDRQMKVVFRVNLLSLLDREPKQHQVQQVGTYTRIPVILAHLHLTLTCG
jgi:site-specific DNA recombinase